MREYSVLILADLFPPQFAPRASYLANFLANQEDWRVTVVTEHIEQKHSGSHGQIFASFEEKCAVHRVPLVPKPSVWRSLAEALWGEKGKRLERYILQHFAAKSFDVILACTYRTFPVPTAVRLAQRWHIPVVADCRDLVEQYSRNDFLPYRPFARWGWGENLLMGLLKRHFIAARTRALRKTNCVTTVSEWHRLCLQKLHPQQRVLSIANGYDEAFFRATQVRSERFRIVFTGRVLSLAMRDPSLLFEALASEALESIVASGSVSIDWYVDEDSQRMLQQLLHSYPHQVASLNNFHSMVPFEQVPALLQEASVVLLLGNKEEKYGPHGMVTTKLFEAMAVERPILMTRSDEGVAAALLKQYGAACAAIDVESVVAFIEKYFTQWKEKGYTSPEGIDRSFVEQYSRWQMATKIKTLLLQLLQKWHQEP